MKIHFFRNIFEKYSDTKFLENLSSGGRLVPREQTDRLDELSSRFRNFANSQREINKHFILHYGSPSQETLLNIVRNSRTDCSVLCVSLILFFSKVHLWTDTCAQYSRPSVMRITVFRRSCRSGEFWTIYKPQFPISVIIKVHYYYYCYYYKLSYIKYFSFKEYY